MVQECTSHPNQVISPFFLVDKPSGGKRFILNLKHLNLFIEAPHFKLEDHRTMRDLITPGCFGTTVDLMDAYYTVPVAESSRMYLRFLFQGRLLQFTCLPMGMSVSPYVFHKLMRPILECLRSQGVRCVNYLDDYGILGSSRDRCRANVLKLVSLLEYLGFIINQGKSSIEPSQTFIFLGFLFDSENMTIALPSGKSERIKQMLQRFADLTECSIRHLAEVIGTLVAACPATPYGRLYTMHLESFKVRALADSNQDFDARFIVPEELRPDIQWWLDNISTISNRLHNDDFSVTITTDASLSGWGASCEEHRISGWWARDETCWHINALELRAIELALLHFGDRIRDSRILIRSDNVTAISCVNRQGSMISHRLFNITKRIWGWCERTGNVIFASYIASQDNGVADECSRRLPGNTEWSLDDDVFQKIVNHFGMPEIDMFASAANAKCARFVSWHPDPRAVGVDAFTYPWERTYFYAFPPFALILKVLQKLVAEGATGIVVVPDWPTQPWYPLFVDLLCAPPLRFGPNRNLLILPFRNEIHPQADDLVLMVGKLSNKPSYDKASPVAQ